MGLLAIGIMALTCPVPIPRLSYSDIAGSSTCLVKGRFANDYHLYEYIQLQ